MDETKIFGEIYEVKESVNKIEQKLSHIETSLHNLTNTMGKVLHIVQRLLVIPN